MDLGIKELGVTFLVGSFAILGLEFVLYRLLRKSLTGFFTGNLGLRDTAAWLFVATGFGVGIVAEDISYKFVDTQPVPFYGAAQRIVTYLPLSRELKSDLGLLQMLRIGKTDLRLAAAVEPTLPARGCPDSKPSWSPTHLGAEIGRLGLTTALAEKSGPDDSSDRASRIVKARAVDAWLSSVQPEQGPAGCTTPESPVDTDKKFLSPLISLFYVAKNKGYAEATHYDELKRLQTRLEFSRSIAVLSYVYIIVALLTIPAAILQRLPGLAPAVLRSRRYRPSLWRAGLLIAYAASSLALQAIGLKLFSLAVIVLLWGCVLATWRSTPPRTDFHGRTVALAFSTFETVGVLLAIHFFGLWAYTREATEYSKRAIGYYATASLKSHSTPETGATPEVELPPSPAPERNSRQVVR